MKRTLIVVLLLAPGLAAEPQDPKAVVVKACDPGWQDTGIDVRAGDVLELSATGTVVHWRSRDRSESKSCGPEGIAGTTREEVYLAPGLAKMGLVGKVEHHLFDVGAGACWRAPAAGRLCLGINDTNRFGGCADNSGEWTVSISVMRSPPPKGDPAETAAFKGTVVWMGIEGGFFGIVADDGGRYLPLRALPEDFRKDDLRVRCKVVLKRDVPTIQMWGTPVEILEIVRA